MANYSCSEYTSFYQYRHVLHESFIASSVLLGLQIIPAVVFNLSILLVIWKTPSLHTPSYFFLFNLALSDLAVAIIGSPSVIFTFMIHVYGSDHLLVCVSVHSSCILSSLFSSVSFLTITAATVDRYLALKLHLTYVTHVTTSRAVALCVLIWLCSAVPPLLSIMSLKIYCLVVFPALVFLLALMFFCYCKILLVIRHHRNQIECQQNFQQENCTPSQNMTSFKKIAYNILVVFTLNTLLYSPIVIGLIVSTVYETTFVNQVRFFVLIFPFVFANSTVNPLLYCWRLNDIRIALKQRWRQL
ncbi:melanocyte-stimulating hormone receptor-like [Exaiptasia diaphana]|uniref:G-protein coupled receptors family 1 profile domain-containing protein n=1 Tax=Exaiptasia diaphana TaxID=2652724 RepID=A0A913YFW1_EXADI|nr:melanocyte-stimulating hormone receptor-like [Exaiptasia diaphana]